MRFNEFITEDRHEHGTYINVKPRDSDKERLYKWVTEHGITNPLDKKEYHITVIYSRVPCPDAKDYDFDLPITGSICGWKIFDSRLGRCLVAHVDSPQLQKINADIKEKYGAVSDFAEYIPHITVSYDYEGDIPTSYPTDIMYFRSVEVKGINPDWSPKK